MALYHVKGLTQKVTLLYEQERKQNLDLQKLDVQEVKDLLLGLKEFGFGMKQEIEYVEGMLGKTLKIEAVAERYLKFYHQKGLTSPNDLKKFLQQINPLSSRKKILKYGAQILFFLIFLWILFSLLQDQRY